MASNQKLQIKSKYKLSQPVRCCIHGHKCSIALRTMSTETLTRSEQSSESVSPEKEQLYIFRLQRAESFSNFKYTRLLSQEYICESDPAKREELTKTKQSVILENSSAFPMKRYYIGIVTPRTAELFVSRNTAFRVYHSLRETNDTKIPLCIVYKNSCGNFYHYLIKERFDENLHVSLLHVDCGDETPPEFIGIEALVKYYTVYASLHSFSSAGGLGVDVFPWWN